MDIIHAEMVMYRRISLPQYAKAKQKARSTGQSYQTIWSAVSTPNPRSPI